VPVPVVWGFEANEVVRETYGYATDVMTSWNRTEQRVQLLRHPRGGLEFDFMGLGAGESSLVRAALYLYQDAPWVVPMWPLACDLLVALSPSDTAVVIDASDVPFQDAAGLGLYAVLWKSSSVLEVVSLETYSPTQLNLAAPGVVGSWPVGTKVIPARVGRLETSISTPWPHRDIATGKVKFTFDIDQQVATVPASEFVIIGGGLVGTT
jgi:hypothetical protein